MPLFLIRRDVPGATQEDIDAAAYRAIACAFNYEGIKWHTSYWDKEAGRLHCVYEGQSREQIEDHSRRARIPCDEVRQVTQLMPEVWQGAASGQTGAVEPT